ncbi:MFS transporter [Brevundimonas sp.]
MWSQTLTSTDATATVQPRGLGFLVLYALAWGGGVIAYVPLLTLILPIKVEAIAPDDKVALLSLATLIGAVVASVINIVVGVASDRTVMGVRGRRPWVTLGLALTLASYVVLHAVSTRTGLIVGIVLFQGALNLMLAPLSATAADEIPDQQKGLAGGLMGAVYTFGALAGMVVTASAGWSEGVRLAIVGGLVTACMLPFLLISRRRGPIVPASAPVVQAGAGRKHNLARVWTARLLIQIAGSILFAYLLFYFETVERSGPPVPPAEIARQVAWLAGSVTIALVPLSIAMGRLSDAVRLRKPFLLITAAMMTVGLGLMALLPQWIPAAAGYVLFATGVGLFLGLQGAYAMQLLITPEHRGRDMGVLNLTNTIPALIAPSLAFALAGEGDFQSLLLVLTGLAAVALILLFRIREQSV